MPADTLQSLLSLCEFMDRDERPLPVDIRLLGAVAERCHAYAKALRYREEEFVTSPQTAIEALVAVNNQLEQSDAAVRAAGGAVECPARVRAASAVIASHSLPALRAAPALEIAR